MSLDMEIRAKIHFFSVLKEYQNEGVGSIMLTKAERIVKDEGFSILHIYTETNSLLEKFLKNRGFVKVGFFTGRFSVGKDANIFAKTIK